MIKSREANDHAGWELIRQGTLSTLSPGMRYSIWRGQSGKIYGETQSAFFDIADSEEAFAALSSEELEKSSAAARGLFPAEECITCWKKGKEYDPVSLFRRFL